MLHNLVSLLMTHNGVTKQEKRSEAVNAVSKCSKVVQNLQYVIKWYLMSESYYF